MPVWALILGGTGGAALLLLVIGVVASGLMVFWMWSGLSRDVVPAVDHASPATVAARYVRDDAEREYLTVSFAEASTPPADLFMLHHQQTLEGGHPRWEEDHRLPEADVHRFASQAPYTLAVSVETIYAEA